ncbi:hypothetical protein GQ600_18938 [Phytophthora cactorum]|nr:hypothetical protein GQ600_18938 [Phytophthora cactorum]
MVPTTSDFDDTDSASERSSLELGARLSQLSRAKVAVALNNVHHVQMCTSYDREERVTSAPRGLPSRALTASESTTKHKHKQSKRERRQRKLREEDDLRADYQVEHRLLDVPCATRAHQRSGGSAQGQVTPAVVSVLHARTGTRDLGSISVSVSEKQRGHRHGLAQTAGTNREERLESFVNLLLRAAKDVSYRSGCNPCGRFEVVSTLLSDFLTEPHLRTAKQAKGLERSRSTESQPTSEEAWLAAAQ